MSKHWETTSPQSMARIGGVLYLVIIAAGLFGELFVRGKLVVSGDAAATADNLRSFEHLWRAGIAIDIFSCACAVVLAWVFYLLLRPVDRNLALLMVFFELICIGLQAAFDLNLIAALFPLGNASYLQAFSPAQLDVLTRMTIRSHAFGFGICLLFFGFVCLIRGYLIFRSGILPKVLGGFYATAGFGYLTHGFALILTPDLADRLFPIVAAPIFIGEFSLCLWLLVRGVDAVRWNQSAASLGM